jgi:hypothetical protein
MGRPEEGSSLLSFVFELKRQDKEKLSEARKKRLLGSL